MKNWFKSVKYITRAYLVTCTVCFIPPPFLLSKWMVVTWPFCGLVIMAVLLMCKTWWSKPTSHYEDTEPRKCKSQPQPTTLIEVSTLGCHLIATLIINQRCDAGGSGPFLWALSEENQLRGSGITVKQTLTSRRLIECWLIFFNSTTRTAGPAGRFKFVLMCSRVERANLLTVT